MDKEIKEDFIKAVINNYFKGCSVEESFLKAKKEMEQYESVGRYDSERKG